MSSLGRAIAALLLAIVPALLVPADAALRLCLCDLAATFFGKSDTRCARGAEHRTETPRRHCCSESADDAAQPTSSPPESSCCSRHGTPPSPSLRIRSDAADCCIEVHSHSGPGTSDESVPAHREIPGLTAVLPAPSVPSDPRSARFERRLARSISPGIPPPLFRPLRI